MTTTDPAITIAGLRAERDALVESLHAYARGAAYDDAEVECASARTANAEAERDALAAALATRTAERDEAVTALANAAAKHGEEIARVERERSSAVHMKNDTIALLHGREARIAAVEAESNKATAEAAARIKELETELASALKQSHRRVEAGNVESRKLDEARAEAAALRQRVAELEARPVLTVDALDSMLVAAAGVANPGHDPTTWLHKRYAEFIVDKLGAVTLPAPTTPRTVDALLAAAGVTVEELDQVHADSFRGACASGRHEEASAVAIRAVLDRLAVTLIAPVDPEALLNKYYGSEPSRDSSDRELIADMRAALTAAGVPVTPERCQ